MLLLLEQTVGTFFPEDPKGGRSTTWAGNNILFSFSFFEFFPCDFKYMFKHIMERRISIFIFLSFVECIFVLCCLSIFLHIATGKEVIAASFRGASDPYSADHVANLPNSKWRVGYNKIYLNLVESGCKSPDASLGSARAGLEWMYKNFQHVSKEGEKPISFDRLMTKVKDSKLYHTKKIVGTKALDKKLK
jgi:hypothetical protein